MLLKFGALEVDTLEGRVRLEGENRPLKPRAFAFLAYLLENRGRVVTKQELQDNVWRGSLATDSALATALRDVRHALGETGQRDGSLRTIHGRGYRFVATSQEHTPGSAVLPASAMGVELHRTVAVLPLEALSNDSDVHEVGDSLADELIHQLSRYRDARVLARQSSFEVRGRGLTVQEIGERLGARYLVEGSVRPMASTLRVTIQLIDARAQIHVWTESYELNPDNLVEDEAALVSSAAASIGTLVKVYELQRAEAKAPNDLDAWENYLLGRELMQTFARSKQAGAIDYFSRAIELAPHFADAFACKAYALVLAGEPGRDPLPRDNRRTAQRLEAMRIARHAIGLDQGAPIAWAALSRVMFSLGEIEDAIRAAQKALDLNPNLTWGHNLMGLCHWQMDRGGEAIRAFDQALATSPLDSYRWVVMAGRACALNLLEQYEDAIDWSRSAQVHPGASYMAFVGEICALGHLGRRERARQAIERGKAAEPLFGIDLVDYDLPLSAPRARQSLIEGLRRAGMSYRGETLPLNDPRRCQQADSKLRLGDCKEIIGTRHAP